MTDPNIDNKNAIDPVMSNLSLDDQAQLFQLLKVEAGMTLTMRKNGAVADGVDVDIAQACFNNMDESTKPLVVDYKIEGGTAVFLENKLTTIRKHTNKSLSSTVQLINLTPGKGMIKATPYLNPKMAPAPVEYEFIGKPRKLNLVLTVTTDNQFSDGVAANVVTATLTDENDGNKPVANEKLEFKLSGTAQFKGTNPVTTDAKGKATISLVSNVNANISVTVTCTVLSELSVTKNVVVTFKAKPKDLKLVLTIVANNRYADGIQTNTVAATLTDPNNNNKPVSNETLIFKHSGSANFVGSNTVTTDANGKAVISLTSGVKTNIEISVGCFLGSNTAIMQLVTVNFLAIPTPAFWANHIKRYAVTSHTDYGVLRAVISLPEGSPSQNFIVRFKPKPNPYYTGGTGRYGVTRPNSSHSSVTTLDIAVTASGGNTNVDAWTWYANGTDFTLNAFAFFQADLLTTSGQLIAESVVVWTEFTGQPKPVAPPPPPPPPAANFTLTITTIVDNLKTAGQVVPGQPTNRSGHIAAVRLTQNGWPVANADVHCSFYMTKNSATGASGGFANDANQKQQQITPQATTVLPNIIMRTNSNGEFSVSMGMWSSLPYPTRETGTLRVSYSNATASRLFTSIA